MGSKWAALVVWYLDLGPPEGRVQRCLLFVVVSFWLAFKHRKQGFPKKGHRNGVVLLAGIHLGEPPQISMLFILFFIQKSQDSKLSKDTSAVPSHLCRVWMAPPCCRFSFGSSFGLQKPPDFEWMRPILAGFCWLSHVSGPDLRGMDLIKQSVLEKRRLCSAFLDFPVSSLASPHDFEASHNSR